MVVSLVGCTVDLLVDGIASGEGSHAEVHVVADFAKSKWHGGKIGMCYCCIHGSHSHCSGCCDCVSVQDPF